ncbi:DUF3006 domain-containing protein [Clostridium sp. 'White wine YQ']|uniref:DUF3006 domain-containing protein n=1 Tax=Clostridium sp. 'White wine YQ' TaxID=3027474 RepID=UPI002365B006|nr:DUF3006 domain-containing protein [Clostridium sp. 'White wine YQ']MDD7795030.1 DUF3006 domain-containing protein [Clostridium sp. 'White wine YQ']
MKYIIDRIEGDFAVCENDEGELKDIDISLILGEIASGKVIISKDGSYVVDEILTKQREEEINKLVDGIWEE